MQSGLNDSASFEIASKANTIEAYRRYLQSFPAGRHAASAQSAIESLTLRSGKTFRDCPDCPMMVVIPAGAFWQGSAESSPLAVSLEKPRHRVTIAEPFAVSVFEITMAQWDACVADSGCDTRPQDNGWGRGNRPVIMVSWNDAMQYVGWLGKKTGQVYSLPSESQWEYLARAGEESDWLGGSASAVCDYGNIAANETAFEWRHPDCEDGAVARTTPAGSYQPNAFGVYDVIGNVAEWTLDCMNLSYLEAPSDGGAWSRGMCSSRMTRGGSWFTGTRESRLAARFNLKNGDRNDFTGFRVVRQVEKQ
jgi:formylglycine-generating enzyme required for sulfatase activity